VVFLLDAPIQEFPAGHFVGVDTPGAQRRRPSSFYMNPFGRPIVVADIGGSFARELVTGGEQAMVDFALAGLVDILGSSAPNRVRATTVTEWTAHPFIRGAYSAARPGRASERARLAEPIADRIFLAGEAVSMDNYATAHGAHLTGIAVADQATAALNARSLRTMHACSGCG
jgi:monoamine oxidase